jgi:hypothetical protein
MPSLLDEICPDYVGERRLVLAVASATATPRAFIPIDVSIDYSATAPAGIALPLELTIVSPSRSNFVRRYYRRGRPSSLTFVPKEGGRHFLRLAEVGHNRWWGALAIDVVGETTDPCS